jgi:hypothetical protein
LQDFWPGPLGGHTDVAGVWDVKQDRRIQNFSFSGSLVNPAYFDAGCFSGDGTRVAVAYKEAGGSTLVWTTETSGDSR